MKRWILLLALPWGVAVSTREYNCTYVSDLPPEATGYLESAKQKCDTAQDWQLTYEGNPLIYCGPQSADANLRDHCEWMKDVSAAFNEMANARKARLQEPEPSDTGKSPEPEDPKEP